MNTPQEKAPTIWIPSAPEVTCDLLLWVRILESEAQKLRAKK